MWRSMGRAQPLQEAQRVGHPQVHLGQGKLKARQCTRKKGQAA
jgi:hypothetical protein